ncbi:MAG: type II toxin-antitoxin system HicA family toxin [Chloroflexi bacterium]|nr:type II toxin-antitoxin system HicA family toxin [Chloroflexota bacterium]
MTQIEKLVERLGRASGQSAFEDVERLLEHHGWRLARQRGSHVAFLKTGERPLYIPLVGGRRVKRVYVVDVLKRLGLWRADG